MHSRQERDRLVLPCEDTCGYRQRVFCGDDVPKQFCSHIMTSHYRNTVLIAHNAKGFDHYPVLNALIDHHAVRPNKILYNGSKIMYMHVAHGIDLTFIDSLNFLGMKLSKIPKCFDLQELSKGYFPHLFNTTANQKYEGPYLYPEFYGVDYMSVEDRKKFLEWHASKTNQIFNFRKEMYEYCVSDVDILRRGCMKFRQIMKDATTKPTVNDSDDTMKSKAIDCFDYVTIASCCQAIYRHLFMEEEYETEITNPMTRRKCRTKMENGRFCVDLPDHGWTVRESIENSTDYRVGKTVFVKSPIAIVPHDNYNSDTFSKISIQWLEWVMEKSRKNGRPIRIQHAMNDGEHRVPGTSYRLDGFEKNSKTAYEFLGCVFHGCQKCFPMDRTKTTHPVTEHSMHELNLATRRKECKLKQLGYRYVSIWEHEFYNLLKEDVDAKEYVSSLDIVDRLNPRDSFFGGRCNAIKLFHEVKEPGETIEYFDFTSLYPYVNKYERYPVGHPVIITSDFRDISSYFGLDKVLVKPPRRLFHPVLPVISNGKLKFPLCKKCAENENQKTCECTDDERSFHGTWCTPELELALTKGYEIMKVYEVYHFQETSKYDKFTGTGGLFALYVNLWAKYKQEANGFPYECDTDERKLEYIAEYARKEGIHLNYDNISINPGLRSLAKICLNSFWGKFGQRTNMKQTSFLYEQEADTFFQLISDPRKEVRDFHIISDDIIQLEYVDDPAFLPMDFKTKFFLATFTTSWARIKLYGLLNMAQERTLYVDTDSIVYVDRDKTLTKKLPTGNYLGELTNEIAPNDSHITHFISAGPKNYSYKTLSGNETCRVRGFSLDNITNSQLINFDAIRDIVVEKKIYSIKTINPRKISRLPRKRKLYNRVEEKDYRMVYTKRRLMNDFTTLPYGY